MWISKKKWEALEKRVTALECMNQSQTISFKPNTIMRSTGAILPTIEISKEEFDNFMQEHRKRFADSVLDRMKRET